MNQPQDTRRFLLRRWQVGDQLTKVKAFQDQTLQKVLIQVKLQRCDYTLPCSLQRNSSNWMQHYC